MELVFFPLKLWFSIYLFNSLNITPVIRGFIITIISCAICKYTRRHWYDDVHDSALYLWKYCLC